jgi:hypothetical protein
MFKPLIFSMLGLALPYIAEFAIVPLASRAEQVENTWPIVGL